jgi:hypothetical protein
MGTSSSEKKRGEANERTSGQRGCGQQSHRNEAIVAEGNITRRRRAAMSANHTEGEKRKGSTLRIGRGALLD